MRILDSLKTSDTSALKGKTFVKSVEELSKDSGASLRIYERSGLQGKYLAEIPIGDAVELSRNFEEALKSEFGGGNYQVALCNADVEVKAKFAFSVAGPPKGRRASDDEPSSGRRSSDRETLTAVMSKLADAAISGKSSGAEEWARMLEVTKALKGDDNLTPKDLVELANALRGESGGTEMLGAYMEGIQTGRELSPQLEREDPLIALAGAAIPIIGQIYAARQRGGAGQAEVQKLEQELRSKIAAASTGTVTSPGPTLDHPLAPGDSVAGVGEPSQQMPVSADSSTPALARTHEYFMERFITPFRRDVAEGQSDDDLAYQLIAMVTYARDRMLENPPPIVADLVAARSIPDYSAGLARFFSALPELANLTHKQEAITKCLMQMLMYRGPQDRPAEEIPVEEIVNVEDVDRETIEQVAADEAQVDIAVDTSEAEQAG